MPKHVELTKKRQDIYTNYSTNKNIINITNITNISNISNITNIIKITNITNIINILNITRRSKLEGAAADHRTLNFYSLAFHANNSPPLKFEFPRKIPTFVVSAGLFRTFLIELSVPWLGPLLIRSGLDIVRINRMFLLLFVGNERSPSFDI